MRHKNLSIEFQDLLWLKADTQRSSRSDLAPRQRVRGPKSARSGGFIPQDPHPAILLFLQWYLSRETLTQYPLFHDLLDLMDRGQVSNRLQWANLLRLRLLHQGLHLLHRIVERPLDQREVVVLYERIEEFVQLYAMGVRT